MSDAVEFQTIHPNGVCLHAAVAGPEDGPLVVLLHGFPEERVNGALRTFFSGGGAGPAHI